MSCVGRIIDMASIAASGFLKAHVVGDQQSSNKTTPHHGKLEKSWGAEGV